MSKHIEWRLAEPKDQPAMDAMHAELERKIGHRMDRPDMFDEPVLIAVVGECDGVIVQGFYLEAQAEFCAMGTNVLPTKEIRIGAAMLIACAQAYKIRLLRSFVPKEMVPEKKRPSAIERQFKKYGFTKEGPGYQQFFRWLVRRTR